MTYGDGVCDVDINKLLEFHKSHGKLATLTAVKRAEDKGVLNIGGDNAVKSFREKTSATVRQSTPGTWSCSQRYLITSTATVVCLKKSRLNALSLSGS